MTRLSVRAAAMSAAAALTTAFGVADVHAQCSTCPTPTVAFAPVVAAPTAVVVAPRMGLFDRWRLRRWGVAMPVVAAAPTYTAAYAPAYTAAYAPAYTAAYAPTYTAAYAPAPRYLTSYAPLQPAVVQTSFMPVTTMPVATVDSCSTCPQTSYYAPTTVVRPAVLTPVAPACSTCAVEAPCTTCASYAPAPAPACSGCSACSTSTTTAYAEQASFETPSSGCTSCASGSGQVIYSTPSGTSTGIDGSGNQALPTPGIETPAPIDSSYPPNDPGPIDDAATDAAFDAPDLLGPTNDHSVNSPTVDVHTAVYHRQVKPANVRSTSARPTSRVAVDAGAWTTTSGR